MFLENEILKVSGMGESAIDELIAPIYSKYKQVQTGVLFNKSEVEVHLTAQGKTAEEADKINDEIAEQIVKTLGIAVFSTNDEKMEVVVGKSFARKRQNSIGGGKLHGRFDQRKIDGCFGFVRLFYRRRDRLFKRSQDALP